MTDPKKLSRRTRGSRHKAAAEGDAKAAATAATGGAQNPALPRPLGAFPIHVRWHDLDALNHVNNASYLVFLEETRLLWLRTVPGDWFNEHALPVMAAVELQYRRPITWPAQIEVHKACERIGNSSITVGNRIVDRADASVVYAEGKVVLVWVDPATGAPVTLPQAIRDTLQG